MRPANGIWRYTVTLSLIGWVHTQNDLCIICYLYSHFTHSGWNLPALVDALRSYICPRCIIRHIITHNWTSATAVTFSTIISSAWHFFHRKYFVSNTIINTILVILFQVYRHFFNHLTALGMAQAVEIPLRWRQGCLVMEMDRTRASAIMVLTISPGIYQIQYQKCMYTI